MFRPITCRAQAAALAGRQRSPPPVASGPAARRQARGVRTGRSGASAVPALTQLSYGRVTRMFRPITCRAQAAALAGRQRSPPPGRAS
jgi:hypothetical protein